MNYLEINIRNFKLSLEILTNHSEIKEEIQRKISLPAQSLPLPSGDEREF